MNKAQHKVQAAASESKQIRPSQVTALAKRKNY